MLGTEGTRLAVKLPTTVILIPDQGGNTEGVIEHTRQTRAGAHMAGVLRVHVLGPANMDMAAGGAEWALGVGPGVSFQSVGVVVRLTPQNLGHLRLFCNVFQTEVSHRRVDVFVVRHHVEQGGHHPIKVGEELSLVGSRINVELQRHAVHLNSTLVHLVGGVLITGDKAKGREGLAPLAHEKLGVSPDKHFKFLISNFDLHRTPAVIRG